ncbi:hypothetical protein GCM10010428_38770 [Actinosynnema pretiosum subsp. pretiosum]
MALDGAALRGVALCGAGALVLVHGSRGLTYCTIGIRARRPDSLNRVILSPGSARGWRAGVRQWAECAVITGNADTSALPPPRAGR